MVPKGTYVKGHCSAGQLFAFLGSGNLKTFVLTKIATRRFFENDGSNEVLLNGNSIMDSEVSFLDSSHESCLYENLSVYETVLFSATLRADDHMLASQQPASLTGQLYMLGIDEMQF